MQKQTHTPGIWSLASGSKANCTLVCGHSTAILIDLGVSCRSANTELKTLGLSLDDIDAVFITHEHSDHIAGLDTFFKKYKAPVFMTEPSYLGYIRGKGFEHRDEVSVKKDVEFTETVGGFTVTSLSVPHDSSACVAYKVTGEGVSLGICTDTGTPSEKLLSFFSDCENVITECNHDVIMLKCGIYPEELKYRILSDYGHTSNDACAEFAVKLAQCGVKNLLLAHVSPENNTPDLALYTVNEALRASGCDFSYIGVAPRVGLLRFPPNADTSAEELKNA